MHSAWKQSAGRRKSTARLTTDSFGTGWLRWNGSLRKSARYSQYYAGVLLHITSSHQPVGRFEARQRRILTVYPRYCDRTQSRKTCRLRNTSFFLITKTFKDMLHINPKLFGIKVARPVDPLKCCNNCINCVFDVIVILDDSII